MVNASSSYISTFPQESEASHARRTEMFLWTMIVVALMDLFLLCWTFKPWARPDNQVRLTPVPQEIAAVISTEKPSPLGPARTYRTSVQAPAHSK